MRARLAWWLAGLEKGRLYLDLIRWDRPAGWLLLLWPTLSALWLAAGGFPGWHLLGVFTMGTILMRSAGCCINDVADRDFDRHVRRTANRPVTRGAVSTRQALVLGAVLAALAFALVLTTNLATVLLSFVALLVAMGYPFAKRWVAMPQAVLGVAFSLGIPMAYSAVRAGASGLHGLSHALTPEVFCLLAGNFCWVLAYDTEYAMVDREDDLRIGMKTSAITLGRYDVGVVMACYASFLGLWAWAAWPHAGGWVLGLAWAVAAAQALWHYSWIRGRTREGCFRAFRLNHWLGFTVCAGIGLGLSWR
jgi:4-hydroxybenzoate polyprenyltransferase